MNIIQYHNSSSIFTQIHDYKNCHFYSRSTAQPHQYVFEDFCAKLIPRPGKSDTQYIMRCLFCQCNVSRDQDANHQCIYGDLGKASWGGNVFFRALPECQMGCLRRQNKKWTHSCTFFWKQFDLNI